MNDTNLTIIRIFAYCLIKYNPMKYEISLLLIGFLFLSVTKKHNVEVVYVAESQPFTVTSIHPKWSNCGSILMTTYKNHEPVYNPTNYVSTGEKITDKYNVPPIIALPENLEKKLGVKLGDTILIKDGDRFYKKVFKDRMQNRFTNRIDEMINSDKEFYSKQVTYFIKK